MKKVIIILSAFLLVGCSSTLSSSLDIDTALNTVLSENITSYNTHAKGFKYYKPRDFSLIKDDDYNHTLLNNGINYYLNVDINGYFNKKDVNYTIDSSLYFSSKINYNGITGFLEIREGNNGYFYIKMMYNYSYIEVCVEKDEIVNAVVNSTIILSSIRYNDKVIESLISSGDLGNKESTYEIKKPSSDNKNILGS